MNHRIICQCRSAGITTIVVASLLFLLSTAAQAQSQASTARAQATVKTTAKTMTVRAAPAGTAELSRFCDPATISTASRGGKTRYSCEFRATGSMTSVKPNPDVSRSTINCDYSETGGVITWLGCTCAEDEGGNCNTFITNCVEKGDTVGGNSGGATCKPSDG